MTLKDLIICISQNPDLGFKDKAEFVNLNKGKADISIDKLKFPAGKKQKFIDYINEENLKKLNARLEKIKASPVFYFDKNYPKLLREIYDFPLVLYCRGNTKLFEEKNLLAVVGSRRATSYGLATTRKIVERLAGVGVVIVSGLALGVDGQAHKAALNVRGKTIAILGTPIDQIYPANHIGLAQEILSSDGVIISEFPPGYPFFKYNFPLRNRIIAGLSRATIVVEAAEKSGALITANLAAEYGREVFAVPADLDRLNSRGTNVLIEQGASCLTSPESLLSFFGITSPERQIKLDQNEKIIFKILSEGKRDFDFLSLNSKLNPVLLNSTLLDLEIKGIIKKDSLGEYLIN